MKIDWRLYEKQAIVGKVPHNSNKTALSAKQTDSGLLLWDQNAKRQKDANEHRQYTS